MSALLQRIAAVAFWGWSTIAVPPPAFAQPHPRTEPGALVSVEWLMANRGRTDVLLIDASFAHQHAQAHIPGAVPVDVFRFGAEQPDKAKMQAEFRSWGVDPAKTVVLHDQGGSYLAASLFFDLYHHGFPIEKLKLLDGGLAKWRAAGGMLTNEPTPKPTAGTFQVVERTDTRTEHADFVTATGDVQHNAIVEALELSYRYGARQFFDRAGHVPRSVPLPNDELFNADKTFKSAADIRKLATFLGITPDKTVHTLCGGGVAAAGPYFALKFIAGYPRVRLYKGSQRAWLLDERQLPFWTYADPHLMRDAKALDAWNHPMLRAFDATRISILDIRSPEQHALGHMPYALSVPAARLAELGGDLVRLRGLLQAAGVDARDEAVIVGEGGVTPDAALAFVTLKALGQARVSILMESLDEWALAGYPITKVPTRVGERSTGQDIVVPARAYAPMPRDGLFAGAAGQPGVDRFERVYVASGAHPPTRSPAGKMVHLPYRELLTATGTPKPAKDIWSRIEKAGIPRHAELVFVADDVSEAAVNYYLFQLMGYPDIKLMRTKQGS